MLLLWLCHPAVWRCTPLLRQGSQTIAFGTHGFLQGLHRNQEIGEVGTFELDNVNGELAVLVVEALDAQQAVRAREDTFRIDVDVFKIRC